MDSPSTLNATEHEEAPERGALGQQQELVTDTHRLGARGGLGSPSLAPGEAKAHTALQVAGGPCTVHHVQERELRSRHLHFNLLKTVCAFL